MDNALSQLEKQLLDHTSLRHAEGRVFWLKLRRLREHVYLLWDHWPIAQSPSIRPRMPCALIEAISCFPLHEDRHMAIPLLPWCQETWIQLEIATRHLALHIDSFLGAYHPIVCSYTPGEETDFNQRILVMKRVNLLRDYVSQLFWWLNALLY